MIVSEGMRETVHTCADYSECYYLWGEIPQWISKFETMHQICYSTNKNLSLGGTCMSV